MGGNHHAAATIDFLPQKGRLVHSENIPLRPENQDMPGVGVNLAAGKDRKVMPPPQVGYRGGRPESVMVGQANPGEAQLFGPVNHFRHGGKSILRGGIAMGMQVNQQKRASAPGKVTGRPGRGAGPTGLYHKGGDGWRLATNSKAAAFDGD